MSIVWRFVKLEIQLYIAFGRWVARRPHVPEGATAWGYSRLVTPVIWLWIFASAAELPLAHVLVPWHGVRLTLLVIGAWGLIWMIGMLASLKVYPHLADADGLRLRYGKFADLRIPWNAVSSVRMVDVGESEWSLRALRPKETPTGVDLHVPVNDRANVHIRLTEPTPVRTAKGPLTITALTFWVDEPREFVAEAKARRVSAVGGREGHA